MADSLDEILDDHVTALKYASPAGQKSLIKGLIKHAFLTGFSEGVGHENKKAKEEMWREYDRAPPFKGNID